MLIQNLTWTSVNTGWHLGRFLVEESKRTGQRSTEVEKSIIRCWNWSWSLGTWYKSYIWSVCQILLQIPLSYRLDIKFTVGTVDYVGPPSVLINPLPNIEVGNDWAPPLIFDLFPNFYQAIALYLIFNIFPQKPKLTITT